MLKAEHRQAEVSLHMGAEDDHGRYVFADEPLVLRSEQRRHGCRAGFVGAGSGLLVLGREFPGEFGVHQGARACPVAYRRSGVEALDQGSDRLRVGGVCPGPVAAQKRQLVCFGFHRMGPVVVVRVSVQFEIAARTDGSRYGRCGTARSPRSRARRLIRVAAPARGNDEQNAHEQSERSVELCLESARHRHELWQFAVEHSRHLPDVPFLSEWNLPFRQRAETEHNHRMAFFDQHMGDA